MWHEEDTHMSQHMQACILRHDSKDTQRIAFELLHCK